MIKNFFKVFGVKEIIQRVIILLIVLLVIDVLNIPTFIIEKYRVLGSIIILLIGVLILSIVFTPIIKLLRINVQNYSDLYLVVFVITIPIYISVKCLTDLKQFRFLSVCIVIESIVIICLLIRIVFLVILNKKIKKKQQTTINVYDIRELYNDRLRNDGSIVFLEEKDVSYDLLNRNKIIDDLYNSISLCHNKHRFIISITGKWGSGKTTILNIAKKRLDKEKFVIINDLNIWKYSNEDILIYEIVDKILKSIKIDISTIEIKKIVKGCTSMLANKIDLDLKFVETNNKSLEKIKHIIEDYLEKNDKRVVFIIDNFERTNENNILVILKAISTILNIDRFIYVLSYDEEEMQNIFEEKIKINYDYMEKVVQLPLKLPLVSKDSINQVCNRCLENLLKHYGVGEEKIQQYIPVFELFNENVKDLRSFKRKLNSICNSCFFGKNVLNRIDSFLIELIDYDNQELYKEIQQKYECFVSEDQPSVYGYPRYNAVEYNINTTRYFTKLFEKEDNKKYKDVMSLLFPNVKQYFAEYKNDGERVRFWSESEYRVTKNKDEYRQSIINRRIFNAKFFDLYFTKQQNEFIEIDERINEFITWINKKEYDIHNKKFKDKLEKKLREVLCLYKGMGQKLILETLEVHIQEIEKNKVALINELINAQEYIDNTMIFLGINARERLEIICSEIVKRMTRKELEIIKNGMVTDYKNINFYRKMLYWINPEKAYDSEEINEEVYKAIKESYKDLRENILSKNVNIYEKLNYTRHNIYCLIDDERCKNQVEFINEETVFKFLADMIINSVGKEYGYSFDSEHFEKITSYENIDNILDRIDKSKMTEIEALIEDVYQKSKNKSERVIPEDKKTIYKKNFVDIGKV